MSNGISVVDVITGRTDLSTREIRSPRGWLGNQSACMTGDEISDAGWFDGSGGAHGSDGEEAA